MQNRFLLILAATLVMSSTAQSAAPPAPATLTPAMLGFVNGILSYCTKIDQRDAKKFDALRHAMIPGAGQGEHDGDHDAKIKGQDSMKNRDAKGDHDRDAWEAVQKDPSYQESFTQIQNTFEGMPAGEALKLCLGAL
jgi:hypothetical protein